MEADFLQPLIALISNMGFPIAMSIYLLHRMEQKLDTMINLLSELNHHLKKDWLNNSSHVRKYNMTWELFFVFYIET